MKKITIDKLLDALNDESKIKRDENGKVYILVPEEAYNEDKPERARTGYEREGKDTVYYFMDAMDILHSENEVYRPLNDFQYTSGNYYTDKQLAEDNARADSILRRMRQWQALNDVAVDRNASEIYSLVWQRSTRDIRINIIVKDKCLDNFEIYFSTFEKASEAAKVFRDDLIWLHTEYRRRLDEVRT